MGVGEVVCVGVGSVNGESRDGIICGGLHVEVWVGSHTCGVCRSCVGRGGVVSMVGWVVGGRVERCGRGGGGHWDGVGIG